MPMARALLQRPSALVAACTVVVVGAFVATGDLRVASGEPAPRAPLRVHEPRVVRNTPPRPAPGVVRRGRVFDALGFLVVGAEVVPMDRPPVRTDGDGAFQVELARGRATDLLVRADGQRAAWLRTSDGSPDVLALQLVPAAPWDEVPAPPPPPAALRGEGSVRGGDGKPLASAYVTALGSGVWARTDDIGRFELPLPAATVTLLVHAPAADGGNGFAALSEPIASNRARGVVPMPDVLAAPALGIRGCVRDARGQPIAGVPVEIVGEHVRRVVDTGAGGAFHLGGLLPGRYLARPFAWRGAVGVTTEVTLARAAVDVDLQLLDADEQHLRVVDEGGNAVAGVFVAASIGGARRAVARADDDGRVAVPVAAAAEFDVRAPAHYASLPVRRVDLDEAKLVVALP